MKYLGTISKMNSIHTSPVQYFLKMQELVVNMNELIGKEIELSFTGQINCLKCNKPIRKTYFQAYCYPCFMSIPEADDCILRPELCLAHEGISRDMEWSKKNCLQDHAVYLSLTSNVKVGVTRFSQIPTRWIDQGASQAIILAKTPNRSLAGKIEVFLKKHLADKTNWRNMLSNKTEKSIDLKQEKTNYAKLLPNELSEFIYKDDKIFEFTFPVEKYPDKVKSINLDKSPNYKGKLVGIKGQYLIFEDNLVINIRKYGAYQIEINVL